MIEVRGTKMEATSDSTREDVPFFCLFSLHQLKYISFILIP